MEATINSVYDDALRQRDLMRKARRSSNPDVSEIFGAPQGVGSTGQLDKNTYLTEMAYTHDRGEPHAAVRPVAQRIAGQPIHVAEVVNANSDKPGEKAWRPAKRGRRRLSIEEMARLPKGIRKRLRLPTDDDHRLCVKAIKSMHSAAVRVDILERHPVLDLLNQPNVRMSGHKLMELTIVSLYFTGKCFWWLHKAKKRPFDMYYIEAHRVREMPDNVELDRGYIVSRKDTMGGNDLEVPAERMIYIYHPDPADIMKARAEIKACMQNVRVGESITMAQEQTFNNGCFPALAFITGDIIAPDKTNLGKAQLERWQLNELNTRISQLFQGPMKNGKHIVLDRVIDKVERISDKPNEMDWMDSYEFNTEAIWASVGTPPIVAGRIKDANRATALVADEAFTNNVVNPLSNMLSHNLNDKLLPLYNESGEDLVMWIEESKSFDRDAILKEVTLLMGKGGMSIDEARSDFGRGPLPNDKGQKLITSATDILEPLDDSNDDMLQYREDLMAEQAEAGKPPSTNGKPPKPRQNPPPSADATATGRDFEMLQKAPGPVLAWLKVHSRQEQSFARDLKKFLDAQVTYIVQQINSQTEPGQIFSPRAQLFNPREWDKGLVNLAMPHLMRCAMTGAATQLGKDIEPHFTKQDVTIDFPEIILQGIRNFLTEMVHSRFWMQINDTTAERLATQIQTSLQAGENISQMSRRVHDALGSQTPARALAIARSETTGGLNAGQRAAAEDMIDRGIITGMKWFANDDAHTRPSHWAAHDQHADENGEFTVGGEKCRFPGDPNLSAAQRVNCRCSLISVLGDSRSHDTWIKSVLPGPGQLFERVERRFIVDSAAPIIQQLLNHGKIREYGIKTLYLDRRVPTWSLRRGTGVKFRLRRYDTGELYFEQKVKRDGMTYKKRHKTTIRDVSKDLIPIGIASYTRTEFEQNGSRVTVDREVKLNGRELGRFIVEVKGKMPEWLNLPEGSEQVGFSKSSAILSHART